MSRRCSRCTTAHTGSSPGAPAILHSRWAPARTPSPSAGLSLAWTRQRRPPSLAAAAGRPAPPRGSPSRPQRPPATPADAPAPPGTVFPPGGGVFARPGPPPPPRTPPPRRNPPR
ncbi:MAG: hypothetical protein AN484_28015, partial [Aphanizomenon flos-aquae WA102]